LRALDPAPKTARYRSARLPHTAGWWTYSAVVADKTSAEKVSTPRRRAPGRTFCDTYFVGERKPEPSFGRADAAAERDNACSR